MRLSRIARRAAALAAAFGIALQALWPLATQARPRDAISVPVCSVDGTSHSIELVPGKGQSGKTYEHCKLCLLGDGQAVLDLGVPAVLFPREEKDQVTRAACPFAQQSRHLAAPPRAPPAVS